MYYLSALFFLYENTHFIAQLPLVLVGGLIGDWTNSGIGRIAEFSKCLNGNLFESRDYTLLFGYPFFGGLPEHSFIQIMGLFLMFSE